MVDYLENHYEESRIENDSHRNDQNEIYLLLKLSITFAFLVEMYRRQRDTFNSKKYQQDKIFSKLARPKASVESEMELSLFENDGFDFA